MRTSLSRMMIFGALPVVILIRVHAAWADQPPGQTSFTHLHDQSVNSFIDAVLSGKGMLLFPSPDMPAPKGLPFDYWKAYRPDISTAVDATFRFRELRRDGGDSPESVPVDISVTFRVGSVLVRHSLVKQSDLAGGVQSAYQKSPRTVTIEGHHGSDIRYVIAPLDQGYFTPAVVMCFIDLHSLPQGTPPPFPDETSPRPELQLAEVGFAVDVRATGEFRPGREPGTAKVQLLTSSKIPNITHFEDEQSSRSPFAQVVLKRDVTETMAPVSDPDSVAEGVAVEVDLTAPSGFRRTVTQRDVIRYRTVELSQADLSAIGMLTPHGAMMVSPRGCALITREFVRNTAFQGPSSP